MKPQEFKSADYAIFIYFKDYRERTIIEKGTLEQVDEFLDAELPKIGGVRKYVVKKLYGGTVKSKEL